MGFQYFSYMLAYFIVLFGASYGVQYFDPELYWKSVLPNTPIPKVVTDFLPSRKDHDLARLTPEPTVEVAPYKPAQLPIALPITLPITLPAITLTSYATATSDDQNNINSNIYEGIFFLENDINKSGNRIKTNLNFIINNTTRPTLFLPRQIAQSIPFSSKKLLEIFTKFSLKPHSVEAEMVKKTIKECEEDNDHDHDEHYCATSLESMVDFTTSKIGKNIQAISTQVAMKNNDHQYYHFTTITQVEKKRKSSSIVVCHKQNYPFAVFYCHSLQDVEAYVVNLEEEGNDNKVIAICHEDTSQWNPKHLAFQILKVKPGTVPICHFLPQLHILWIQN
ncbi:BURP domain protein RD22 [Cannabis sativa]|uniref:BURP domain protein RD22 n=1 Tax=Cannabis sativa TaxID=3483 RepID=UPI0029CA1734|nr:BURP domain protein RD22 [Cannabis sativa]